jgi:hypothetical protein
MILWTLNLDPQGAVRVSWLEVEPSAGGGTQALTPALFTNSATFYTHAVTPGAVVLLPGLFTNSSAFYGPAVTVGAVTLLPGLFTNSATFYGPTVTGGIPGLNPTGLAVLLRRRRR